LVEPREVVDEGPPRLAKGASTSLCCMYEENTYRRSTKDGCLQTILS